jgi:hypothetical protein
MRWLAVIAMCFVSVLHAVRAGESEMNANAKGVVLVANELRGCALWTEIPQYDIEARKQITATYIALAHLDTETIRAGIASYIDSYILDGQPKLHYIEAIEKVYAFLHVVFKVPQRADASKGSPFGLMGNPVYPDGVDLLWPISIDRAGRLKLTGVDSGLHTGVPYDPLSDFDKMASQLERRFPATRQPTATGLPFLHAPRGSTYF